MSNFSLSLNEALDSTQRWKENSEQDWVNTLQDLIQKKPFGDHKFYVFMFVKRVNDITGVKKMYMQPRLTKPDPVPGTTLMHVNPKYPEEATMIWTLPNENNFKLYQQGKQFADSFVHESIDKYLKNPKALMRREEGDLSENEIRDIYRAKAKGNSKTKTIKF